MTDRLHSELIVHVPICVDISLPLQNQCLLGYDFASLREENNSSAIDLHNPGRYTVKIFSLAIFYPNLMGWISSANIVMASTVVPHVGAQDRNHDGQISREESARPSGSWRVGKGFPVQSFKIAPCAEHDQVNR